MTDEQTQLDRIIESANEVVRLVLSQDGMEPRVFRGVLLREALRVNKRVLEYVEEFG